MPSERLRGRLSGGGSLQGKLSGGGSLRGVMSQAAAVRPYSGPYQITPSEEQQVLSISGLRATQDIIIDPIPQNYGLVAWNGAFLTIT